MRLNILEGSILEDIINIINKHPTVKSACVNDNGVFIESVNIDELAGFLEGKFGVHLVLSGGNYKVGSRLQEEKSLAEKVAEAGAKAAEMATSAVGATDVVDSAKEKIDEKNEENESDAEEKPSTYKDVKDSIKDKLTSITDALTDDEVEKMKEDPEMEGVLDSPELKKLALSQAEDDEDFIKIPKDSLE